jgi:hypothetical protein
MESNEYEFNIFNECIDDMINVLPFYNYPEDISDQDNYIDFLNIDVDFNIDKNIPDKSYEIFEKLNRIEENYNNIIINHIQQPTISIIT